MARTQGRKITGLTAAQRFRKGIEPSTESKYSLKVRAKRKNEK